MSDPQDRLSDLGWAAPTAEQFRPYESSHCPARVCRVNRGGLDLVGAAGAIRATPGGALLRRSAQERASTPAVGDWAAVRDWSDGRVTVEALLPRRTAIVRDAADRTSHGQAIAANVDVVVIVEHLEPEPDPGRIERLLVLTRVSGAVPLIVLTKTDLVPDPTAMRDEIAALAPGVDLVVASAHTGDGIDEVRRVMSPGRTLAFLGPSGAGKSTLINLLAGADLMATAPIREHDGRGRHTTTHRELITVPHRGVILDTPGLRSVGLVADADAVAGAYPDIDELAARCRFRDCAHEAEPGCAVLAAVDDGDLGEDRLHRWRKLAREADRHARRSAARRRR
ncbi:ribosome biogenesis GTPase [Haloactinopolyspora alba]|uniref:Small ribosomal subunit biogenesis GTPase RsgA n=1 Tax=Haloactinopolyspora alba TaxID=648780 RepID=A0A2P8DIA9_9ACTN|nr:ribosome small subunit-dependent GTPase A [Haloactinopolyspora alba]PSK96960.1 ribosome biogenesis GTPase [Haloactinopolyspora alba]